ncbi:MAG: hypothetical protein ACO1N4_10660 [Pedobacter sp.]
MNKRLLFGFSLFFSFTVAFAQQKVKDGTAGNSNLPNKDALLELESTKRGLLHARVPLVATTNPAPLSAHVAGMISTNRILEKMLL